MAIYSAVPPPPAYETPSSDPVQQQQPQPQEQQASSPGHLAPPSGAGAAALASHTAANAGTGIDIDAWTVAALQSLSVSPIARGTGTPLAIPIDDEGCVAIKTTVRIATTKAGVPRDEETPRRPPSRRDSQRKREALLKGKEGSRQRRRWENDRLMHVPNVQPPQPKDWEVHPTHPIHHHVPYQLAHFWDRGVRQRVEDKTARLAAQRKAQQLKKGSATGLGAGEVPRDLRETAKRVPAVKSWVRAMEEPVRQYLRQSSSNSEGGESAVIADGDGGREAELDGSSSDLEEDEIVFAGRKSGIAARKGQSQWKKAHREVHDETVDQGMVFDSFGDDESASFKRWLTHSISDYYGLESTSVVMANPSRKVVYIRLKQVHQQGTLPFKQFPRPLWELC